VAKIVLSLVLVRWLGLAGIALGTVIPLVVTNLLVIPVLSRRFLGVRPAETLRESVWPAVLTLVVAGPLAWGWLELTRATDPAAWRLRYQIPIALGVLAIYAVVAWFLGLKRDDRDWVRVRLPWRRRSARRPDRSATPR
jgi:peptidoglycan biosynthesis protein MviN/MurJ (putative lipid II flippase)